MFEPWFSNAGAAWSDGPVASMRVQALDVIPAMVRAASRIHLVVERDMATPFHWLLGMGDRPNLGHQFAPV